VAVGLHLEPTNRGRGQLGRIVLRMNGEDKRGEANRAVASSSMAKADRIYKVGLLTRFPSSSLSISILPRSWNAMTITRRGQREVSRSNSRCLRSRAISPTATAIRLSIRQPRLKCMNGGMETESNDKNSLRLKNQTCGNRWRSKARCRNSEITQSIAGLMLTSSRQAKLGATSLLVGHEGGATCDEQELLILPSETASFLLDWLLLRLRQAPLYLEIGEKEGSAATKTHATSDATAEIVVLDPDDVGIPNEGKWNLTNAYEFRFCFEHGQQEWLLQCADRWMRPSEFNVYEAKAKLEIKLWKYQREPWGLEPDLLDSRAECNRTLWSHLDTPMKRGKFGDEILYLCRRKFFGTPETNIDNKDWAEASRRARDQSIGQRRSARIKDTATYRTVKCEQMMRVINLENWL
jgi:hypothetical protein